jgi:hypothetical protein
MFWKKRLQIFIANLYFMWKMCTGNVFYNQVKMWLNLIINFFNNFYKSNLISLKYKLNVDVSSSTTSIDLVLVSDYLPLLLYQSTLRAPCINLIDTTLTGSLLHHSLSFTSVSILRKCFARSICIQVEVEYAVSIKYWQ